MRYPLLAAASVAVILTLPGVAVGQQLRSGSPSALDSLTAQLVELELERVSSIAAPIPQISAPRDIGSRIDALHERLLALPGGTVTDREASGRVLLALDARAASVHARLQQLRLVYTETHPLVQQSESEQRVLDARRSEIRRAT